MSCRTQTQTAHPSCVHVKPCSPFKHRIIPDYSVDALFAKSTECMQNTHVLSTDMWQCMCITGTITTHTRVWIRPSLYLFQPSVSPTKEDNTKKLHSMHTRTHTHTSLEYSYTAFVSQYYIMSSCESFHTANSNLHCISNCGTGTGVCLPISFNLQ